MAKYVIDETTLQGLANSIRKINGETKTYTPDEMIDKVTNILESVTYILVDDTGKQIPAVYTEGALSLTATPNDIRIGTTAVTDAGITEGEKEIPSYVTSEGIRVVPAGSSCVLPLPDYDYTKLQAIFCPFNTSLTNSVSAEKVVIEGYLYPVQSTTATTNVVVDNENKRIDFGITNTYSEPLLIRYFSYKEIY